MRRYCDVVRKIKNLQAELENLEVEKLRLLSYRKLLCIHCQKSSRIRDISMAEVVSYVQPYGYTGGGYYQKEPGEFLTRCPKCLAINRHLSRNYYALPYEVRNHLNDIDSFLLEYKKLFKEVCDSHHKKKPAIRRTIISSPIILRNS